MDKSLQWNHLAPAHALQKGGLAPQLPLGTKGGMRMNSNWMPGVAALMGLALAGPATASAQVRDVDERGNYRYESYSGRAGFENGYEDGLKRGRHDGEHRARYDVTKDSKYREGDHGYKRSYGPMSEYVRSYRQGYEQGYSDGFAPYSYRARSNGRYGGYGRNGGYYGPNGGYYGADGRYYGRDGRYYDYRDDYRR
jgi:hypothetical protein